MTNSAIHELRRLNQESETAKGFFELLARRKNSATVTKVDRALGLLLADGVSASRGEVIRIMQRLRDIGMGRFIIGRKGQPSRIEWSVNVISMSRAATGQTDEIDMTLPESANADEEDEGQEDVLEHRFHLRSDFTVTVELPVGITTSEAERLANFIRTLPIQ
jgi:hypothetical protein